jgi:hypothetical protein
MADRDLITEGRAALKANATFGIVKLGQWARANLGALLDALEAKHTQHAETLGYLEHAYEVIEAQRPPLGYVAMGRPKDSDGPYGMLPARNLATDKLAAETQRHRFAKDEDMHVILAELREVPDAG